jgi:hypothetical protein
LFIRKSTLPVYHALLKDLPSRFCHILQPLLEPLIFISIALIQMTEEQVESYSTDLNAWVLFEILGFLHFICWVWVSVVWFWSDLTA